MTDLYRMIDELHEAVEPLREEVMFRRYPLLRMVAGINKLAEAYRQLSINLNNVLDGVSVQAGELVEVSAYGEPPRLYEIGEGSTADNWLVEAQ